MSRFTEIKDKLRVMYSMTIVRKPTGEYRVNFQNGIEDSAYYSDDLEDAFASAISMRQRESSGLTSGLTEVTEQTMIAAHKAGIEYWKRNKPHDATDENLRSLARSCGWHGDDNDSWLAGFKGAKKRNI